MRLYHGSKIKGLSTILSLNMLEEKGVNPDLSQSSDISRDNFREVVFLTTSLNLAEQYAGKTGQVYEVSAPGAVLYQDYFSENMSKLGKSKCLLNKKLKKLQSNKTVYVASGAFVIQK